MTTLADRRHRRIAGNFREYFLYYDNMTCFRCPRELVCRGAYDENNTYRWCTYLKTYRTADDVARFLDEKAVEGR